MAGGSYPNSASGLNNDDLNILRSPAELHLLGKDKVCLRIVEVERKNFLRGGHYGQQSLMGTRGMEFSGPSFIEGRIWI